MINSIKYYYNLNINDIKQINNDYFFDNYVLKRYYKEINIDLYNFLINQNIYLHKIVYNRNQEFITVINNNPYILLKMEKQIELNISVLENYNIPLAFNNPNWASLWSYKIDYYEKSIDDFKDEIIQKSFQYFIGMAENAIILFKSINTKQSTFLCHFRFNYNYEFYDPLNITIDYKMRDYAEYIKEEFYSKNKYYDDFISKLINNYKYDEIMLFFIRMLYPTAFFDACDDYLKKEKVNYNFYEKQTEYEKYLKRIYKMIKKKYNIMDISWLK